jgi:beta-galactosidase
MAIVQSTKTTGTITVEASSPGLIPASVTISSKVVKLRPQAPVWEREVPEGPGITGLWRSEPAAAAAGLQAFSSPAGQVFTFRQSGNAFTGTVEGGGGSFFGGGGETPAAIEEGKVEGADISFSAARVAYTGTLKGDVIVLIGTGGMNPRGARGAPTAPAGPRPAIGPPPDGSDPSNGAFFGLSRGGGRGFGAPAPIVLHRAKG